MTASTIMGSVLSVNEPSPMVFDAPKAAAALHAMHGNRASMKTASPSIIHRIDMVTSGFVRSFLATKNKIVNTAIRAAMVRNPKPNVPAVSLRETQNMREGSP